MEYKYKIFLTLSSLFLLLQAVQNAPTTQLPSQDVQNAETIVLNQEPSPISELIQQQTDAIKKILSASSTTNKKTSNKNCQDIENGLKEALDNPKAEEKVQFENSPSSSTEESITVQSEIERGDVVTVSNEERNIEQLRINTANGRNFNLNKNDDPGTKTENQNYILIPCIKKLVNNDGIQKVTYEEVLDTPNSYQENTALTAEDSTQNLNNVSNQNAYVLEKVYSPSGYFLYYIYRLRNSNPFPIDYTTTHITPSTSTSTSTTTTSTTTEAPASTQQDPVYQEQLKFVIQMPYVEPDIGLPPQRKFDQYSYYPQEFQPSYMNAPIAYHPSYHMIRTLVIPNEYSNLAPVDNNSNNENYDNLNTQ